MTRTITRAPDASWPSSKHWPKLQQVRLHSLSSRLGGAAERSIGAADLLSPFVHELHERTGMIAWAARADGTRLEIVDTAHGREHSRAMAQDWPVYLTFETMPDTAAGQLLGLDHPEAVEAVLRCGLPRATAYTVTMPGGYLKRLSQVRDTGLAMEHEEYRLGWWCAAVSIGPPEGRYLVGTTGPTSGASTTPQRVQGMLHRCREDVERELQTRN